jgi:predicted acyl esterase
MWATAHRFRTGECIRIDVSSADFPRFDRNANLGGLPGTPVPAEQRIFRGGGHASYVVLQYLPDRTG